MWTVLLGCLGLLGSIRGNAGIERCPQGWMTSAGACYRFFQEMRTWKEAENHCRTFGATGHLASILDAAATINVGDYINSYRDEELGPIWIGPIWIGMFYKKNSLLGDWGWTDGYKIRYTNWIKGSPNVSENGKYCVYLVEEQYKYWKETDCNRPFPYLCKLKYQRR